MSALLEVQGVSKTHGNTAVLRNLSFTASAGTITTIISADYKKLTALLELLSLSSDPDIGDILLNHSSLLRIKAKERRKLKVKIQELNPHQKMKAHPRETCLEFLEKVIQNIPDSIQSTNRNNLISNVTSQCSFPLTLLNQPLHSLSQVDKEKLLMTSCLLVSPSLLVVNSLAYKYSHSFYEVLHKLKQSLNIPILFITQQIPKQLHTSITYLEDQSLPMQ
ncbi:hypothetical protein LZP85_10655 [Priestia flexa]|uniref:Uncharacterized protein n=1 Tax=Priestia flexa TaxID=86664 RepID=A0A8I1MFD7_9BACI|nr:hypothetical protein [Priestia flexa]MBN8252338.1 hypothetical protein [Priestia flexa]MBN8435847.1 hypothetical protein [Priestia flexa]MCA0968404.1 hypothetical protein [Priestia flexa]UIR28460.1 hypothetical protein LZP85_10655 [Priestia flexa]UZW65108.1 hypothetical protein OC195_12760 [Priestia flexa]